MEVEPTSYRCTLSIGTYIPEAQLKHACYGRQERDYEVKLLPTMEKTPGLIVSPSYGVQSEAQYERVISLDSDANVLKVGSVASNYKISLVFKLIYLQPMDELFFLPRTPIINASCVAGEISVISDCGQGLNTSSNGFSGFRDGSQRST